MAGKKTDKDLFSDFFGDDDLGWLDEEAEAKAKAAAEAKSQAALAAEEASADDATAEADPPTEAPEEEHDDQDETMQMAVAPSLDVPDDAENESPAAEPAPVEAPVFAPPPPPPPVPRGAAKTVNPKLGLGELTPVPSQSVTKPSAPMPAQDPEETLIAAPAGEAVNFGGEQVSFDAFERDPMDETIGAFLEPLESGSDPEALETVTDAHPSSPVFDGDLDSTPATPAVGASLDVPDDTAEALTEPGGDAIISKASPAPARVRLVGGIERGHTDEVSVADAAVISKAVADATGDVGSDDELAETLSNTANTPRAAAPLRSWTPQDTQGGWAEAVTVIEAAASDATGVDRARLLLEAARLRRDRLADLDGAIAVLNAAAAAGGSNPDIEELRAETSTRANDPQAAADALARRAALLSGPAAAEAWQAAAMLARHRLSIPDVAETQLREAISSDSTDYASLSLLRDQLSEKGRERDRAKILEQISGVATGRVAAEAWWELGRLHHRLGEEDAARIAYRNGRDADPAHGPCFLALQALAVSAANDRALGELYQEEANREGQTERAWWLLESARAFSDASAPDLATEAFAAAVDAGHPSARREHQAWLLSTENDDAYLEAVKAEVEAGEDPAGRPFALYRYGRLLERRGDFDGAVKAFREVVELDPDAAPAAEAAVRSQEGAGQFEDLLEFYETQLEASEDPAVKRMTLLRMAELAESGLSDLGRARTLIERLLQSAPTDLPALHMARRVYRRLEAWPELAEVYETLATGETDVPAKAQHLIRAGALWEERIGDPKRAREAYGQALQIEPHNLTAVDSQVEVLEGLQDYLAQAEVLRGASDAVGSTADRVRLSYRAGQVFLDRLGDAERAGEAFRRCLEFNPDFEPAMVRLRDVSARTGEGAETYRLYVQQAQGMDNPAAKHWRLLAAADLASDLNGGDPSRDLSAVLEEDPNHPGAMAAQELRMLAMGAKVGLLNLYRQALQGVSDDDERSRLLVRVAHLFEALGDALGVQGPLAKAIEVGGEATPFRALARLAEGQRLWGEAAAALKRSDSTNDRLERARLMAQRLGDHEGALELYASLIDDPQGAIGAALGAAALAQRVGNADLLLQAHATLAERGESEPVRAAHGLWSAQLAEAAAKHEEALRLYLLTLGLRPASKTAFEGARRLMVDANDSEALTGLWAEYRPDDLHGLALDLEQTGDLEGLMSSLEQALAATPDDPALLMRMEQAKTAAEDWPGLYATVSKRAVLVSDPEVRATADAKRRWLLAEKLSGTDDAWELYRSLHEENPDDREVISALAGIALARGETRLAIGYLESLATGATDPAEAAELRVRTASVHEAAENLDEARQSLLDALDHQPDHQPALDGLKRLARGAEDWPGLLAILQREAGLAEGDARVDALVNVATTTASRLDDSSVTMDAWRAVLDEDPNNGQALTALVGLAEAQEDWAGFLQHGKTAVEQLDGAERTGMLNRMAVVSADHLSSDESVALWERAITEGPANVDAAARLREHYKAQRDGTNAIRVLKVHADIVEDAHQRAVLLADAAELELEGRSDRDAVASLYQQVFEANPDEPRALRFLSDYHYSKDNFDEALPVFERLAPIVENDQDLEDFDVCMELASFYYHLASMMIAKGRGLDALPHAEKALQFNPQHQPTLQIAAPLYFENKSWAKANDALKKLLQLTGGRGEPAVMADIYAQLGDVERALTQRKKASKHFAKALDLVEKHPRALRGLAGLFEDEENWTSALDRYNDIITNSRDPEDVTSAYLVKGRILDERLNRPDKAAQHYMKSIAYDANQPDVLVRLAELSLRREDNEEAVGAARRGLDLVSSGLLRADLLACEAVARHHQGDEGRASAALEEAREVAPEANFPEDPSKVDDIMASVRSRLG